jgi:hypothetical protein
MGRFFVPQRRDSSMKEFGRLASTPLMKFSLSILILSILLFSALAANPQV